LKKYLLIIILLVSCRTIGRNEYRNTHNFHDISNEEAFFLIEDNKNNPSFIILDVRTPDEFNWKKIPNSINIDYYSTTFFEDIDTLPKEYIYLVYCKRGARSFSAYEKMIEWDFRNIYNMSGGITAWIENNYPVE